MNTATTPKPAALPLIASRFCREKCRGCPLANRPASIGLVLGGGGAKAAAHLGVLKVFEHAGIAIESIAASSAGALVGLFRCAGYTPDELIHLMQLELAPRGWRRWVPGGQYLQLLELLRGGGLQRLVRRYIKPKNLEDLAIPFAVSTTDLRRGEAIILDRGPIETALMATMCLPGFGRPVRYQGRYLVDGSVLCDLPVEGLQRQRARLAVGVNLLSLDCTRNVNRTAEKTRWNSWQVLTQSVSVQMHRLASQAERQLDVVIRPDFGELGLTDFRHMDAMVNAGQRAAHHSMGALLQSLQRCRNPNRTQDA